MDGKHAVGIEASRGERRKKETRNWGHKSCNTQEHFEKRAETIFAFCGKTLQKLCEKKGLHSNKPEKPISLKGCVILFENCSTTDWWD